MTCCAFWTGRAPQPSSSSLMLAATSCNFRPKTRLKVGLPTSMRCGASAFWAAGAKDGRGAPAGTIDALHQPAEILIDPWRRSRLATAGIRKRQCRAAIRARADQAVTGAGSACRGEMQPGVPGVTEMTFLASLCPCHRRATLKAKLDGDVVPTLETAMLIAIFRTFLVFFLGGLLIATVVITVVLIGRTVWLDCFHDNATL